MTNRINEIKVEYGRPPKFIRLWKKGVIYISKEQKRATMLCPCGCGGLVNLTGHDMTENDDGTISFSPSILAVRCKAHFFIKHNKLEWC